VSLDRRGCSFAEKESSQDPSRAWVLLHALKNIFRTKNILEISIGVSVSENFFNPKIFLFLKIILEIFVGF
jgi:hypothetical protein